MPTKKTTLYTVVLAIFVVLVGLLFPLNSFFRSQENLTDIPFREVSFPDGYLPGGDIFSAGNGTFLTLGINRKNLDASVKVFLVSSDGIVLDSFGNFNNLTHLSNIENVGFVVSDNTSNLVNGNINSLISVKNNKIVYLKELGSNFGKSKYRLIKTETNSSNVLVKYKCYLKIDIENGTCMFGMTTIKHGNNVYKNIVFTPAKSVKIDETHTALILSTRSNDVRPRLYVLGGK